MTCHLARLPKWVALAACLIMRLCVLVVAHPPNWLLQLLESAIAILRGRSNGG